MDRPSSSVRALCRSVQRDGRIYRAKKIFKKVGLLVGRFFDKNSAADICGVRV
jgi:hypothetical protein